MTSLVERLRTTPTERTWDSVGRPYDFPKHLPIEAADEIERLQRELAEALEDRARFPDKPDGVGRMIEAHIGNLKAGKEAAEEHAKAAYSKLLAASAEIKRLTRELADREAAKRGEG